MEDEKKEKIALFRFGVISELVGATHLDYGDAEALIRQLAGRRWDIPFSPRTVISASTIRRWVRLYERGGRDWRALIPMRRSDLGTCRVVDQETVLSLVRLKKANPGMTVRQLISRMAELDLMLPEYRLSQSTAYRLLKAEGLTARHPLDKTDRRRYEADGPNELWQSDVMHGPSVLVMGRQRKVYLIVFLDDHSRLIPHGEFYTSEGVDCYLDALRQALLKRGLPRKLYVDNGAAFRSHHLEKVCASLGISKHHAQPYTPQGKGKVERFFRTVRQQFLTGFCGKTIDDLNHAFDCWLEDDYHKRKHSSTGEPPLERWAKHMELVRRTPGDLEDHFRKVARRRVAKDRVVSLDGRQYEAPATLIGEHVVLLYHEYDPDHVEVLCKDQRHGLLRPLDKHVNADVGREKAANADVNAAAPKSGRLPFGK
jgi:transposase InsO family protein